MTLHAFKGACWILAGEIWRAAQTGPYNKDYNCLFSLFYLFFLFLDVVLSYTPERLRPSLICTEPGVPKSQPCHVSGTGAMKVEAFHELLRLTNKR